MLSSSTGDQLSKPQPALMWHAHTHPRWSAPLVRAAALQLADSGNQFRSVHRRHFSISVLDLILHEVSSFAQSGPDGFGNLLRNVGRSYE
jgi:hypothetical protein